MDYVGQGDTGWFKQLLTPNEINIKNTSHKNIRASIYHDYMIFDVTMGSGHWWKVSLGAIILLEWPWNLFGMVAKIDGFTKFNIKLVLRNRFRRNKILTKLISSSFRYYKSIAYLIIILIHKSNNSQLTHPVEIHRKKPQATEHFWSELFVIDSPIQMLSLPVLMHYFSQKQSFYLENIPVFGSINVQTSQSHCPFCLHFFQMFKRILIDHSLCFLYSNTQNTWFFSICCFLSTILP